MNKYGLLGGKLGHSLSPAIHQAFFKYVGLEGSYELLETELDALPQRMEQLRAGFVGVNVTIPHKLHVIPLLDGAASEAKAIGAVNTIKFTDAGAFGYNTDYFGFKRLLEYNNIEIKNKTAVVLGSGGAARAVVKCLADEEIGSLYLATRRPDMVDADLKQMLPAMRTIGYDALMQLQGDVLINCTPVGMYPNADASPVNEDISQSFAASVDLIYNPQETLFLRQARLAGKQYVNGLFMLVAQAVAAQEIWQNAAYDSKLIVKIMDEINKMLKLQ